MLVVTCVPLIFNPYAIIGFGPIKAVSWAILVLLCWLMVVFRPNSAPHNHNAFSLTESLPQIIYLSIYTITTISSINLTTSIWGVGDAQGWTTIIIGFLFYLLIQRIATLTEHQHILQMTVLTAFAIAFYGGAQMISIDPIQWANDATPSYVQSTLGRSTELGAYLAIIFPLSLWLWTRVPKTEWWRPLLITLLIGVVLLLTLARSALIALAVAIAVFVLLQQFSRQRLIVAIVSFVGLATIYLLVSQQANQSDVGSGEYTLAEERARTVGFRVATWQSLGPLIRERWGLGYGPETFEQAHTRFYPREPYHKGSWLTDPHNIFLYHLLGSGVLGVASFLWVIGRYYVRLVRLCRDLSSQRRHIAIALTATMSAYLTYLQFNPNSVTLMMLFWLMLGMESALQAIVAKGIER